MSDLQLLINLFTHYKGKEGVSAQAQSTQVNNTECYILTIQNKRTQDLAYHFFGDKDVVKYSFRYHFNDGNTITKEYEDELNEELDKGNSPFSLVDVTDEWIEVAGAVSKDDINEELLDEIDDYIANSPLIDMINDSPKHLEKVMIRNLDYLTEIVGDQVDAGEVINYIGYIKEKYLEEIDDIEKVTNCLFALTKFAIENGEIEKHYISRLFELNMHDVESALIKLLKMKIINSDDENGYLLSHSEFASNLVKLYKKGKQKEIWKIIRDEVSNEGGELECQVC